MTGLHAALAALADEWETKYGIRSEARRVFGPQKVSIEYAVRTLRTLAAQHLPVATDSTTAEVEDGFGGYWTTCGPGCDLQVVRPGKVQCNRTGSAGPDANAPEPSDRAGLSETERSAVGCSCTRLDGEWHHVTGCRAPAVERILADRLAVVEQEAGRLRTGLAAANDRANDWMAAAAAREDALRAAEQEAATLRAQIAAVEEEEVAALDSDDRLSGLGNEAEDQLLDAATRFRAALGDSAQVVQRINDEAVVAELETAKAAVLGPSEDLRDIGTCQSIANDLDDQVRARRVRDGGDHG